VGVRDAALEDLSASSSGRSRVETLDQALELRKRLLEVGAFAVTRQIGRSCKAQRE